MPTCPGRQPAGTHHDRVPFYRSTSAYQAGPGRYPAASRGANQKFTFGTRRAGFAAAYPARGGAAWAAGEPRVRALLAD